MKGNLHYLMIFGVKEKTYNAFLSIATNTPALFMTASVLQGQIIVSACSYSGLKCIVTL